jgi:hypothetical protein
MRFLFHIIDWEYPDEREGYAPYLSDLNDKDELMSLYLAVCNGVILEMRAEAETPEGIDLLHGLLTGAGGCRRVELDEATKQKLWLYHEGDRCYLQGRDGFMFIDPNPKPEKFPG